MNLLITIILSGAPANPTVCKGIKYTDQHELLNARYLCLYRHYLGHESLRRKLPEPAGRDDDEDQEKQPLERIVRRGSYRLVIHTP